MCVSDQNVSEWEKMFQMLCPVWFTCADLKHDNQIHMEKYSETCIIENDNKV